MHKYVSGLALTASLLLGLPSPEVSAAPATQSANNPALQGIQQLQKLETVAYRGATAFYLYNVLNRDPQQFRKMQTMLTEGDGLVGMTGNAALQLKWAELKRACTSANFTSEGVADNDSINAVDSSLNDLATTIRSNISEKRASGKVAVDKMSDMLYDQYVTMQIMTSAYLRYSADYFGGAIVASRSGEVEIDKLAIKFGNQMNQLNKHYGRHPKIGPLLKEVTTRWVFVRQSFIKFNENNVPFVVGRYNEQITDKLLQAYALSL